MESTSPNFLIKPLLAILLIFFLHHIRALSPSTPLCSFSFFPSEALPTKTGYLPVNTATSSAMFYVFYEAQDMLQSMTGLATLNDVTKKVPYKTELLSELLRIEEVKKALGVKLSMDEICSDVVAAALHDDFMKSVMYMVELLVKKGKVLLYQGNFDLRDGVVSTEAWVKTLRWDGLGEFSMAERKVWTVNGRLSGYLQKWGNLSQVVVLGAGHPVPSDQTLSSQAMIEDWVFERGLFGYEEEVIFSV